MLVLYIVNIFKNAVPSVLLFGVVHFCSVLFTALTSELPATLQTRIVINATLSVRLRLLGGGGIDVSSMSHAYGFPDHFKF